MLEFILPAVAEERFRKGEIRLVDVRDPDEYEALSIPGARLIPLSVIDTQEVLDPGAPVKDVVFFCRSGNRTRNAASRLEKAAARAGARGAVLEGGLDAWEKAGLPVNRGPKTFPLFRQIQIGAGALVLLGFAGSALWAPFLWLSALVGAGLVFAGLTGFCGLGVLLGFMPWNRRRERA